MIDPLGGPTIRIDQPGPLWAWFDPRAVVAVVAAGLDRANAPVGSVVWVTVVSGASDGTVVAIADGLVVVTVKAQSQPRLRPFHRASASSHDVVVPNSPVR